MKDRIKKIRKYFGLSQAQFAQMIKQVTGFFVLGGNRKKWHIS